MGNFRIIRYVDLETKESAADDSMNCFELQYQLHRDCCNGVSLHPTRPIFATSSGQHHFIDIEEGVALKSAEQQENSLIFWWCGSSDCE